MKIINCNLCGKNKTTLLYKTSDIRIKKHDKTEFNLELCKNCGLAYINPQPEWDELESFYGKETYNGSNNLVGLLLTKINRIINNKSKFNSFNMDCGKFLNIGCDVGKYEQENIPLFPRWSFYGIEPGKVAAAVAKRISGLNLLEGKLNKGYYPNNFFDVILLNHSLEHLPNPTETLSICFSILKPGGHIIIGVPNFDCPMRYLFGAHWTPIDIPRHLFHFTPKTLKKMLIMSGFKIDSLKFESSMSSFVMSMGNRLTNFKDFIKNNKILWPVFAVFLVIIPLIMAPLSKISEWIHISANFRVIAFKK